MPSRNIVGESLEGRPFDYHKKFYRRRSAPNKGVTSRNTLCADYYQIIILLFRAFYYCRVSWYLNIIKYQWLASSKGIIVHDPSSDFIKYMPWLCYVVSFFRKLQFAFGRRYATKKQSITDRCYYNHLTGTWLCRLSEWILDVLHWWLQAIYRLQYSSNGLSNSNNRIRVAFNLSEYYIQMGTIISDNRLAARGLNMRELALSTRRFEWPQLYTAIC
jgi:hypothetical protein